MADHIVIGIDCGASKVMVQTASFDRELNRVLEILMSNILIPIIQIGMKIFYL